MNEILKKRIEYAANYVTLTLDNGSFKDACKHNFEVGARYAISHQWIKVEESLPEYDEAVIVAFGDDDYALLHRSNNPNVLTDKNSFCNYGYKEVLAWMPIPKFEPNRTE